MVNSTNKVTDFYFKVSDKEALKKIKTSSSTEIWEYPETGAKSLHATTRLFPGDVISQIQVKEYVKKPNYLSLQIDEAKHIMLAPEFLQYINHSCEPNVFFNTTNMVVTCLKKIEVGEALTFFYPSTEWSMEQGFDCLCESEQCLAKIQGAAHLSPDILKNYKLSDHITKKAINLK